MAAIKPRHIPSRLLFEKLGSLEVYRLAPWVEAAGITRTVYKRWLNKKANAHRKRDKRRCARRGRRFEYTAVDYRRAVHRAVWMSLGFDAYTGEYVHWNLLKDDLAKDGGGKAGVEERRRTALRPSIDHPNPTSASPRFVICSARTNDCKSDLTVDELKKFARLILKPRGTRRR